MTPQISTFHAACGRILRRYIHHLGYESSFAIYDDKDSERLLKDVLAELDLDDKRFHPQDHRRQDRRLQEPRPVP